MIDSSFKDEINEENKRVRRLKIKYLLPASAILLALITYLGFSLREMIWDNDSIPVPNTNHEVLSEDKVTTPPNPASKPKEIVSTVTNNEQTITPSIGENEINFKLCQSIVDRAKDTSELYNSMYHDSWKHWNEIFYGKWDTLEAIESMNWYKDYIKDLFDDYEKENSPIYNQTCGAGGSITDVIFEPDYTAWD